MKELLAKGKRIVGAFFQNWTRAQTISLVVLAGALVLALLSAWAVGGAAEYRLLGEGTQRELHSLQALLERRGIRWRSVSRADGTLRVEVQSGDDYRRALEIAEEHGYLAGRGSPPLSLDAKGGVYMPPEKLRIKVESSKRRMVEESILFNPKVASVRFIVSRSPPRLLESGPGKMTAAVGLQLKPSYGSLDAGEAQSIHDLVSGAFDIPPENIRIVDQRGNRYGPSSKSARVQAIEDRIRGRIVQEIKKLYLHRYRPREFELGVMVNVSSRHEESEEVRFDREGTFSIPTRIETDRADTDLGGYQRTEQDVVKSKKETKTTIPAGEVLGVGVTVILDRQAVQRVLEKEASGRGGAETGPPDARELDRRIDDYEAEQAELLARLIPYPATTVKVEATHFTDPGTGAAESLPGADSLAVGVAAWRAVLYCAIGVVVASLCWFILARRRRRAEKAECGPEVEDADAKARIPSGLSAWGGTLELARSAAGVVRERPDVAASILRLWLASDVSGRGTNGHGSGANGAARDDEPFSSSDCGVSDEC